jgi:hypothetical protein
MYHGRAAGGSPIGSFSTVQYHAAMIATRLRTARDRVRDWWSFEVTSLTIWLFAPPPEREVDRAIRERGERLRRAFPSIDWDEMPARRSKRERG